jgi:hypothetical protein
MKVQGALKEFFEGSNKTPTHQKLEMKGKSFIFHIYMEQASF